MSQKKRTVFLRQGFFSPQRETRKLKLEITTADTEGPCQTLTQFRAATDCLTCWQESFPSRPTGAQPMLGMDGLQEGQWEVRKGSNLCQGSHNCLSRPCFRDGGR